MADGDEEQLALGMLEASLGDRHRSMNGLHIEDGAGRRAHAEMLEIVREIDRQATQDAATATRARHQRPRRGFLGMGRPEK